MLSVNDYLRGALTLTAESEVSALAEVGIAFAVLLADALADHSVVFRET